MGNRWLGVGVVGLLALAGSLSGASAQEEAAPASAPVAKAPSNVAVRSFERFELDSGVAEGLWAEGVVTFKHNSERDKGTGRKTNTSRILAGPRLVYGIDMFEGGLVIPYRRSEEDIENGVSSSEDGIGDITLYGKAVPLRSEYADLGGGLVISLPSGDKDEDLGTGEAAFLPYVTGAVHLGFLDVLAHGGYSFTVDKTATARDSIWFGGGLHTSMSDRLALRGEFVGKITRERGEDATDLSFQPGVDINFPLETVNVLIRPTGAIGMTDDTPDFGVGGSVVVLWNPS